MKIMYHGACYARNNIIREKSYRVAKRGLGRYSAFCCEKRILWEMNQCESFLYCKKKKAIKIKLKDVYWIVRNSWMDKSLYNWLFPSDRLLFSWKDLVIIIIVKCNNNSMESSITLFIPSSYCPR